MHCCNPSCLMSSCFQTFLFFLENHCFHTAIAGAFVHIRNFLFHVRPPVIYCPSHNAGSHIKHSFASVNHAVSTADVSLCIQSDQCFRKTSSHQIGCSWFCIHLMFNILNKIDSLMAL